MKATPFAWKSLEELGLNLTGEAVFDALRPFAIVNPDRRRYAREMALRRQRLIKRLWRRTLRGWSGASGRSQSKVRHEYEEAWSAGLDRYDITAGPASFTPWIWRGQKLLVDAAGSQRFRGLMLGAVVSALRPRKVLEVGCGDGVNLALLAGAFPEIEFTGLELTETGHRTALALQQQTALPPHLAAYAPLPQNDVEAFRRIAYIQGDATHMPFAAGSFDLVLTVLSVEQMEQLRRQALADIARVTGKHLLMIEPFRDVNDTPARRLNVASRDYFRGSVAELGEFGLQPLWVTDDFPQEVFLGTAMVLSEKRT
jgi:SAM-dependent methyltransferase